MIYALLISISALLGIPLQIAFWWKVFGIWPQSWLWFIGFSLLFYAQSELVKWLVKKLTQDIMEQY